MLIFEELKNSNSFIGKINNIKRCHLIEEIFFGQVVVSVFIKERCLLSLNTEDGTFHYSIGKIYRCCTEYVPHPRNSVAEII